MRYMGRLSGLWLVFLLLSPTLKGQIVSSATEKPFLISMYPGATSQQNQMLTLIYKELFSRLGILVDIQPVPMKRASVQASKGKIDGEAVRVREYSQLHPNLRRVDFPVVQVIFGVYARHNDDIHLDDGWEHLYRSAYRIGHRRGVVLSEQNLKQHVEPSRLDESKTAKQGLLKLIHGRTDLFVYTLGVNLSDPEMLKKIQIVSVLQKVPLYLHVHKRHEKLIPKLEKALHDMQAEGRLSEICTLVYQDKAQKHCLQSDGAYSPLLW